MAAKNKDSNKIFDLYVNRFLAEQENSNTEETESEDEATQSSVANNKSTDFNTGGNFASIASINKPGVQGYGNVNDLQASQAQQAQQSSQQARDLNLQNYNTGEIGGYNMSSATPKDITSYAAAPAADATATTPAATSAPRQPTPEEIKQYGRTGAELRQSSGGQFMSRADRMDQSKVDAILGQGKYKAGTVEANMALANYFKNNPTTVTPGTPGSPAGSTAPTPTGAAATAPTAPASTEQAPGVNVPKPGQVAQPSQQEVLARLKQSLGSQGYDVSDNNKLYGVAKGLGLVQ